MAEYSVSAMNYLAVIRCDVSQCLLVRCSHSQEVVMTASVWALTAPMRDEYRVFEAPMWRILYSVNFYHTTRPYNQEDSRENLKSQLVPYLGSRIVFKCSLGNSKKALLVIRLSHSFVVTTFEPGQGIPSTPKLLQPTLHTSTMCCLYR